MVGATLSGIVKDWRPFADAHLPEGFPGREQQREQLRGVLDGARRGHPGRVWIYGPPGAGKSSLVRDVLNAAETLGTRTVYLNCYGTPTFFSCVDGALNELRALVGDIRDGAFKFERLARIARQEKLMVAFDEIDLMYAKERNAALYNFCTLQGATMICLSNKREDLRELDPRVRSRLQPVFIECPAYRSEELLVILGERAEAALHPGAWSQADLEVLAQESAGDARVAITALRSAAIAAEKVKASALRRQDLKDGLFVAKQLRQEYALKDLSEQHRLLYQLVSDAGEVSRADLWERYQKAAPESSMPVMSKRTFNHYVNYLVRITLLEERQGNGRGNRRLLRVVRP